MRINIIGTGKLGTSLLVLFQQENIKITGILDANTEKSIHVQKLLGSGIVCSSLAELPKADLTMISVCDDQIETVTKSLYQESKLQPGHILFHCSGLLNSKILKNPSFPEVYCASVHPLRSFAMPVTTSEKFKGTFCAIEGDTNATDTLAAIFEKLGAKLFYLNSTQKTLYHSGCVIASNYLITLANQALLCFEQAGIEADIAQDGILNLMQGTINNLHASSCIADALTGPIQRGDLKTLKAHLESLSPNQQKMYALMGLSTLELCKHEQKTQESLYELFKSFI